LIALLEVDVAGECGGSVGASEEDQGKKTRRTQKDTTKCGGGEPIKKARMTGLWSGSRCVAKDLNNKKRVESFSHFF